MSESNLFITAPVISLLPLLVITASMRFFSSTLLRTVTALVPFLLVIQRRLHRIVTALATNG